MHKIVGSLLLVVTTFLTTTFSPRRSGSDMGVLSQANSGQANPGVLSTLTVTGTSTVGTSVTTGASTINGSGSANGESLKIDSASELLTLSTVATTTDTVGNLLPANSMILAVDTRVTTTITTAANFSVGDATTATRFANALAALSAGSTNVGTAHLNSSLIQQVAAAKVRITTNVNPGAGVVRITVHFITFTPPAS